jgi:AraC-like DNA-binding protein
MAMSGRHLQRKLKSIADQKPVEYLRAYRLRKARKLLETGQLVSQVADAVGFSSPAYFTSCFKACFGLTPSEFQQLTR